MMTMPEMDDHSDDDQGRIHQLVAELLRNVVERDGSVDGAIGLMRRLPPRNVLRVSERYYGHHATAVVVVAAGTL